MTAQELATKQEAQITEMQTGDIMMNAPLLAQIDAMASRMASSKATIPDHLKGNEGDCWAIIMQSIQWGMNPYVVAQKTHIVSGKLGYEAQLVNAVVQNSGLISSPFRYDYRGEGEQLECRVGAILKGDTETTWNEWLMLEQVKIRNSPLWKTNPKQQIGYLQLKNFTRQYCPGPILGVYTVDELPTATQQERDVTPQTSDLNSALKQKVAAPAEEEAIDAELVEPEQAETSELTFAMVADALNNANSPETLASALDLMASYVGTEKGEDHRDELSKLYRARLSELRAIADEQKQ